jgi:NAD(P)-dependent dehydrogenase (short-subunit alcohol dehydrogenase family)
MPGQVASVTGRAGGIGRLLGNRWAQNRARSTAAALNLWVAAVTAHAIRGAIAVGVACDPSAA